MRARIAAVAACFATLVIAIGCTSDDNQAEIDALREQVANLQAAQSSTPTPTLTPTALAPTSTATASASPLATTAGSPPATATVAATATPRPTIAPTTVAPLPPPPGPSAEDIASLEASILLGDLWGGYEVISDDFGYWQSLGNSAGTLYSHADIATGMAGVNADAATYLRDVKRTDLPGGARDACFDAYLSLQQVLSNLGLLSAVYADIHAQWPNYDGFAVAQQYLNAWDDAGDDFFAYANDCLG